MPTPTNQVATQRKTLKEIISAENFKTAIEQALPQHLKAERFLRVAITALARTPKLQNCTQESFLRCLLDLSAIGLEPDGRNAHLIPFEDRRSHTTICTLIVDYKGIVNLVRRSGEVSYIKCAVVYKGDIFDFGYGSEAFLKHRPNLASSRAPEDRIAVYSYVKLRDGSEDFQVWGMSRAEAAKKRSPAVKANQPSPWTNSPEDYDEMAQKAVFRNHSKWLPLSSELKDIIERDDDVIDLQSGDFELPPGGGSQADADRAGVESLIQAGDLAAAKRMAHDLKLDWTTFETSHSRDKAVDDTGGQSSTGSQETSVPSGQGSAEANPPAESSGAQTQKLDPREEAFARGELVLKDIQKRFSAEKYDNRFWAIIGKDFSMPDIPSAARSPKFQEIVKALDDALAEKKAPKQSVLKDLK